MKKKVHKIFIVVIILCMMLTFFTCAQENKKVVLIVMNETSYEDLYNMSSVNKLIDDGAIALMNNRTSTRANTYKAYATIGAGVRAEASSTTMNFYKLNEKVKAIYKRRTGIDIPSTGIINLDIVKLNVLNEKGQYGAILGSLGQSLHDYGMKTAAIGNADYEENFVRLAPVIAMDYRGYVDYGNIGKDILAEDETYPFGVKSNYKKMLDVFKDSYKKSQLIVVDIGDIGRLERYAPNLSDEMYLKHKSKVLGDADRFISDLLKNIDIQNTMVILVSPYPSSKDIKNGNTLTPVIFYGDGINKGVLTSSTTRRIGVIGNVDIAPSITVYLGTDSHNMSGRAAQVITKEKNYEFLMHLNEQIVSTSENRYPVLSSFAVFEILVSMIGLFMILLGDKINSKMVGYFKNILLSTMTVPFVLLILPLLGVKNLILTYVFSIGLTILITYIIKKTSKHPLDSLFILSFITTIGLLTDICTGANLMKRSLLGYDPIIGARYYGIGNEYMGVLIGATLVFATIIIDRFRLNKLWSILIFSITILIIGFPKLGANVGGTMTAVAAFIFVALRLFNIKIKLKQFILIGTCIVLIVALMAFIDMKILKSQSHLAGAVEQIMEGGPSVIFLIIKRKISMNIRLIGITIWSKVLMSAIAILATLFYRPVGIFYRLTNLYPNLSIGWSGIVMACIVAFFVNDSGVVAAATGIIFLAMSILYLTFFTMEES
ncbi:hypothetical protein [Crassaminicella indica]|uniref:Phosphoglyceromutase n=1 Tax=Crassaminicella indica TaxID=2855394 RepID=A0ABX8RCE3_9CLOT|nr:hypothetical protein [Crassaminicella indica]QXM05977.1 hypothetical protein KVH43_11540 [Crassaminicella indica]